MPLITIRFEDNIHNIYPPELKLNKEQSSFLDLDVTIADTIFSFKLYDKRDEFGFLLFECCLLEGSDMPFSILYASFNSELLGIARCTTSKDDFLESGRLLMARMSTERENSKQRRSNGEIGINNEGSKPRENANSTKTTRKSLQALPHF